MSSQTIQELLQQRHIEWTRFHQFRSISPRMASLSRIKALRIESQLEREGFMGLN